MLAASGALLGHNLRVYYNSDDMRTVRAFLANGTELGVLKAQGAWGEICHGLKLRREIMKLRGNKRLVFTVSQKFIDRFIESKKAKAKKSRRAANDLERTLRALANAPTSNTPPGPSKSSDGKSISGEVTDDQSVESTQQPKIEPQKLTIGFGYASGGL